MLELPEKIRSHLEENDIDVESVVETHDLSVMRITFSPSTDTPLGELTEVLEANVDSFCGCRFPTIE